ncbi:MAG: TetR/AcrR family transcriptional regulator [Trebonia sp.]
MAAGSPASPAQRMTRAERERLIGDAATRLFARQGYAATTVDDIVRAAGVTKPMLYRHWESKQELGIALFERHREELVAAALGVFDAGDSDRRGQVAIMARAWFEHARQHPDATRFLNVPVTGDPELERVQRDLHARQRATLAALLRELASGRPGAFSEADAEAMGEAVRASLAALALWRTDHPDVPGETLTGVLTRMVQGLIGI